MYVPWEVHLMDGAFDRWSSRIDGVLDPSDRGFPCLNPPGGEKQKITLQHLHLDRLIASDV